MSSRGKSSKTNSIFELSKKPTTNNYSDTTTSIIIILYNLLILNYIVQLEDKKCGCITDWRHDFIKNFSIILIVWGIISILFNLTKNNGFVKLIKNLLNIAALINIWCLYTYVGDLDKTKCMCAIDTQKNMHYFLYIWRYVLVGALILSLLAIIGLTLHIRK
jgi:hypothetical protein